MRTHNISTPSLFILESLRLEDEAKDRFEGRVLRDLLWLSHAKRVRYMYIRTKQELSLGLQEFSKSGLRYLHISCHGNQHEIALTLDTVPFAAFASLASAHVRKRRLFFSACEVVNRSLADALSRHTECHSVIGPCLPITFGDAALMWASFYHLVFRQSPDGMNRKVITTVLGKICPMFQVKFDYYRRSTSSGQFKRVNI